MKVVYEAGNIIDAHLVRHALEHAGIPVFIQGEALTGGIGELPLFGIVAVCVPTACWPDAQAVLRTLPIAMGYEGHPDPALDAIPGHPIATTALP